MEKLTREQKSWAYEKWCEGATHLQIADALDVCDMTILRALKGRPRIRPVLKYEEEPMDEIIKELEARAETFLEYIPPTTQSEKDFEKGAEAAFRESIKIINEHGGIQ